MNKKVELRKKERKKYSVVVSFETLFFRAREQFLSIFALAIFL